ncbi:ribokinase [Algoriphagus taiwanensis]|uniref:Ribokinase n=1 Tax=Algoriphagus taiwanensis TaxID=1445656 RepID=A0ABQ6Q3P0_9BACT|nr:ribokinase [Algoriphagus taiwanensis]
MPNILIVGSSNTDMVVQTERFPLPGETLTGGEFFLFQGGKGANQAVASARMGGTVHFLTKLGKDMFGQQTRKSLRDEGISPDLILEEEGIASGVALILVEDSGENQIVVVPGANGKLSPEDLTKAIPFLETADLLLCQLETPIPTVEALAQLARKFEKRLILNPAPAQALPESLYQNLFLITPNETEASLLSGIALEKESSLSEIGDWFLSKGVQNIILTLGEKGAYFHNSSRQFLIPSQKVKAIDTTGAGDVFNGTLVVALAEGMDWEKAIQTANRAAAISVTRMGAQPSIPFRSEVYGKQ